MQTLHTLFKDMNMPSHRTSLVCDILRSINILSEKQLRRQKNIFLFGMSVSFMSILFSLFFFGNSLVQSDFWSIFSIIFSDISVIVLHFSDFGFLLLETFPVVPLLILFVPVFFFCILFSLYHTKIQSIHRLSY